MPDHKQRMSDQEIVQVVAALIQREEDGQWQFMACQRPAHKARGNLWEFPGGKTEPGETPQQALIRECQEELDVTLYVEDLFMKLIHEYEDITIELLLFNAGIEKGEPKLLEHQAIEWMTADQIDDYEFCPADADILKRIKELHKI